MTWTRQTRPLGSPPSTERRPFHYAASRTVEQTVALCGASWPTGNSEGKSHCTPPARCAACEAIRSAMHSTAASKAKVERRGAARRAAEIRNKAQYAKTAED